jgi:hypothetical protein
LERSRHQPVGREPITFIPSMSQRVAKASAAAADERDDRRHYQHPGRQLP